MLRSLSHLLAAVFANCRHFRRDWEAYRPPTAPADSIEGRWEGEWISEANGHQGRLRGILRREGELYRASFHATYAGLLRVCYSVQLEGKAAGGRVRLKGEADLGRLAGGAYHYEGDATPEALCCEYRCRYDHGTFRMRRVD